MAERERYRTDRRAVRIGVTHGAIAVAVVVAFGLAVAVGVRPFVQLVGGALPIPLPGWKFLAATAAGMGFLVGGASMRSNRRLAGASGADYVAGASAIERARDRLADTGGQGSSEPRSVRRWDPRLLDGGPVRTEPGQVITDGNG